MAFVSYRIAKNPPTFLFPASSVTQVNDLPPPKYGDPEKVIQELTAALGEGKISRSQGSLDDHSDTYFQTKHASPDQRPKAVIYVESTEDVSTVLKCCHKHRVPVVPFTGGTSLEGHFTPTREGVCIDLSRMNKVIALHKEDLDIVVQPAVGWEDLREYLNDYNLLFGPDPGVSIRGRPGDQSAKKKITMSLEPRSARDVGMFFSIGIGMEM